MGFRNQPLLPQWRKVRNHCVCTPDGGFLYIGLRNINYISSVESTADEPLIRSFNIGQTVYGVDVDPYWPKINSTSLNADVDTTDTVATSVSIDCNPSINNNIMAGAGGDDNSGDGITNGKRSELMPPRMFAVIKYDNSIQIWDFDKGYAIQGHKAHCDDDNGPKNLHISYICNRNLLSVDKKHFVIYLVASNTYYRRQMFIPSNHAIAVLKCSPYNKNQFAIGTSNGLVLLCDLKQMAILYTLRGHDCTVTSLAWNKICSIKKENQYQFEADLGNMFDIHDYNCLDNEFSTSNDGAMMRTDIMKSSSSSNLMCKDREGLSQSTENFNIAKACKNKENDIKTIRHQLHVYEKLSDSLDDDRGNVQFLRRQAEMHTTEIKFEQQLSEGILETKANESISTGDNEHDMNDGPILLASMSVSGSLWLWNTNVGCSSDYYKVPQTSQYGNNVYVYWLDSNHLITLNKMGNFKFWSVQCETEQINGNQMYKLKAIKRTAFNDNPVVMFNVCPTKPLLWGLTSNKEIFMENLQTNTLLIRSKCWTTNIMVMKECRGNLNKIALGFVDRRVGIIDISKIIPNGIQIVNFSKNIGSHVIRLEWSPNSKKLAYGTIEGRVGILDVENPNRIPRLLNSICGKPIHSICWQENYIYVLCNKRVGIYDDTNKFNNDGFIIPDIMDAITLSVYEKYLFIGTQNGQLHSYVWNKAIVSTTSFKNFSCKALEKLQLVSSHITHIEWCPIITNQVAIASNSNVIYVFDFNTTYEVLSMRHKITVDSTVTAFVIVKWSNYNANRLMACGIDEAVRVWDLPEESNNEMTPSFIKQYDCPITYGLFLPTDDEIIICTGKNISIEIFDMRLEKIKQQNECQNNSRDKFSPATTLNKIQWAVEVGCKNKLITKMLNKSTNTTTTLTPYLNIPRTLMYLTGKELNQNALEIMYTLLTNNSKTINQTEHVLFKDCQRKEFLFTKLFGTRDDVEELLNIELKNVQSNGTKHIANIFMPHLTANLKDEIDKCIQNKNLTEWHVTQAPKVSYKFWENCCHAFAQQLLEQGHALMAATYMLTIQRPVEAIEMLMEKKYYKEAFVVARMHFQLDDPLCSSISEKWIGDCATNGQAALICLLTDQKARSIECLTKNHNRTGKINVVLDLLKN